MNASCPLVLRIVSASVAVINKAGKIIRDIMSKGDLGIVQKGINDLQTEADRSAQRYIVASLSRQFPKITIIGEETLDYEDKLNEDWLINGNDKEVLSQKCPEEYKSAKEEDVVIWVDPLDGTSEYTQGLLDHVTVLIGIAVQGKAVGGIIHQPYYNYQVEKDPTKLGRTMWGITGIGSFGIARHFPPKDQCIIATTRSHSNQTINAAVEASQPTSVLRVGGAGHKVLLLIEGKAHAYVFASSGCKKWDTCAPEAILHSLGGKLTDIYGNTIQYHKSVEHVNGGGVLATYDATVHDSFCSKIPEDVKKSLSCESK